MGHLRDIAVAALGLVAEDGLVRLGAVQPRHLAIAYMYLHERHQVVGTVQQSEEVGARRRGHGQPCFSSTDVLPHVERRQRRRASTGEAEMRDVLFVLVRSCRQVCNSRAGVQRSGLNLGSCSSPRFAVASSSSKRSVPQGAALARSASLPLTSFHTERRQRRRGSGRFDRGTNSRFRSEQPRFRSDSI